MTIKPQLYKTHDGKRLITHAVYSESGVFLAYCRCFCVAEMAIKEIQGMNTFRNRPVNLIRLVRERSKG